MSIVNLQEISPNTWKALYQGNYGTYTIKVKTDGKETVDFSCSCPSSYYPCKHIPMIESAIKQRIAQSAKTADKQELTVSQILKDLSQKELYDFIVRQAQFDPQLQNKILLEFAHKTNKKGTNNYTQILRKALNSVDFDYEDLNYDYDSFEIDVLDHWLDKAQDHANRGNTAEAILICRACIEEYAVWHKNCDSDIIDYVDSSYQDRPFDILIQTLSKPGTDCEELFKYCKSEMLESKYKGTEMADGFSKLLMKLSVLVGSDDFIALQDKLLQEEKDKSSWEAQKILNRKIEFYRNNGQQEKAWDVIKGNLQIDSFRKELTEKLITEKKYPEAKKLIDEIISKNNAENSHSGSWFELRLQIAQKENDIPVIRSTSLRFIESRFDEKYYKIYKSTFTKEDWPKEAERLIQNYEKQTKNNWFKASVADVLQAEKQAERLMNYIEKHLSVDNLEQYYSGFSSSFPEKTLEMFRQIVERFAQNTGREHYERIVDLFKKMVKIEGGRTLVKEMINQYRMLYKNRKAMMEIMLKFEKGVLLL
jgi:hypothetical protein